MKNSRYQAANYLHSNCGATRLYTNILQPAPPHRLEHNKPLTSRIKRGNFRWKNALTKEISKDISIILSDNI